ncbi:uncharacterized protein TNCT_415971 [Trichonephila clavata]|uniref:Uncharacterized protein n=1 Tax=Trichonephila clavata TaxID=2740835 RepID=A0A8X6JCQ5_TRICU|nr:uncharacterized protein TNCT_415971 [Trichonephila clavata]
MGINSSCEISEGALVIQEYGRIIGCPTTTVAKALVLYHRFQRLVQGHEEDLVCIPAAILSISVRLCDDNISDQKIVLVFYHKNLDKKVSTDPEREDPPSDKIEKMVKSLSKIVYFVSRVLSHTMDCEIAHTYVFEYLNKFQELIKLKNSEIVGLSTTAARLLSTFYLCQKCIKYEAEAITAACIHFIFVYFDLNVPELSSIMSKELGDYADKEKVSNIIDDMMIVAEISTNIQAPRI